MGNVLKLLQDILMLKQDDGMKVGLTQFKPADLPPVEKEVSIRTKDVKLSDLMRRAG